MHEHFARHAATNSSTRAIVFAELRSTVYDIVSQLSDVSGVLAHEFVGQAGSSSSKSTFCDTGEGMGVEAGSQPMSLLNVNRLKVLNGGSLSGPGAMTTGIGGLNQQEQAHIIQMFHEGKLNVLVATCIAEEGLDIGDVDMIVLFDSVASPTRLVQRMGRTGRKRSGRVIMLTSNENNNRDDEKISKCNASSAAINAALYNPSTKFRLYKQNQRLFPDHIRPTLVMKEVGPRTIASDYEGGNTNSDSNSGHNATSNTRGNACTDVGRLLQVSSNVRKKNEAVNSNTNVASFTSRAQTYLKPCKTPSPSPMSYQQPKVAYEYLADSLSKAPSRVHSSVPSEWNQTAAGNKKPSGPIVFDETTLHLLDCDGDAKDSYELGLSRGTESGANGNDGKVAVPGTGAFVPKSGIPVISLYDDDSDNESCVKDALVPMESQGNPKVESGRHSLDSMKALCKASGTAVSAQCLLCGMDYNVITGISSADGTDGYETRACADCNIVLRMSVEDTEPPQSSNSNPSHSVVDKGGSLGNASECSNPTRSVHTPPTEGSLGVQCTSHTSPRAKAYAQSEDVTELIEEAVCSGNSHYYSHYHNVAYDTLCKLNFDSKKQTNDGDSVSNCLYTVDDHQVVSDCDGKASLQTHASSPACLSLKHSSEAFSPVIVPSHLHSNSADKLHSDTALPYALPVLNQKLSPRTTMPFLAAPKGFLDLSDTESECESDSEVSCQCSDEEILLDVRQIHSGSELFNVSSGRENEASGSSVPFLDAQGGSNQTSTSVSSPCLDSGFGGKSIGGFLEAPGLHRAAHSGSQCGGTSSPVSGGLGNPGTSHGSPVLSNPESPTSPSTDYVKSIISEVNPVESNEGDGNEDIWGFDVVDNGYTHKDCPSPEPARRPKKTKKVPLQVSKREKSENRGTVVGNMLSKHRVVHVSPGASCKSKQITSFFSKAAPSTINDTRSSSLLLESPSAEGDAVHSSSLLAPRGSSLSGSPQIDEVDLVYADMSQISIVDSQPELDLVAGSGISAINSDTFVYTGSESAVDKSKCTSTLPNAYNADVNSTTNSSVMYVSRSPPCGRATDCIQESVLSDREISCISASSPSKRSNHISFVTNASECASTDDTRCCICGESSNILPKDCMIFCEGPCQACVHVSCYLGEPFLECREKMKKLLALDFYCDGCKAKNSNNSMSSSDPKCGLCNVGSGLLKYNPSGFYFHPVCVLFTPELTVDVRNMQLNNIHSVDPYRNQLICYLCKGKGGACVQCAHKDCVVACHPYCSYCCHRQMVIRYEEKECEFGTCRDESVDMLYEMYCNKHWTMVSGEKENIVSCTLEEYMPSGTDDEGQVGRGEEMENGDDNAVVDDEDLVLQNTQHESLVGCAGINRLSRLKKKSDAKRVRAPQPSILPSAGRHQIPSVLRDLQREGLEELRRCVEKFSKKTRIRPILIDHEASESDDGGFVESKAVKTKSGSESDSESDVSDDDEYEASFINDGAYTPYKCRDSIDGGSQSQSASKSKKKKRRKNDAAYEERVMYFNLNKQFDMTQGPETPVSTYRRPLQDLLRNKRMCE